MKVGLKIPCPGEVDTPGAGDQAPAVSPKRAEDETQSQDGDLCYGDFYSFAGLALVLQGLEHC